MADENDVAEATRQGTSDLHGLRMALFCANYAGTPDGASNALHHLVAFLLARGAEVRIYSPTLRKPTLSPPGTIVSVPSLPIPGRSEYRLALGLPRRIREDVRRFQPTVIHMSVPDILGSRAQRFGRKLGLPIVSSFHTRFDTYLGYYGLGFLRPLIERHLRSFYRNCDFVLAPNDAVAEQLERAGVRRVAIWQRGVDSDRFSPSCRDEQWRHGLGIAPQEIAVLFFGRLVAEKGIKIYAAAIEKLQESGCRIRPLVIGEGAARESFAARLPGAIFTGHLCGTELARAVASADVMINPSVTEGAGNVNLEAMACGVPVISANVPSAQLLIENGRTGLLVHPDDIDAYVDAVHHLAGDPDLRTAIGMAAAREAARRPWSKGLETVVQAYYAVGALPRPSAQNCGRESRAKGLERDNING